MTPQEAAVLADKIKGSWPSSKIAPDVWAEELAPLDAGRAGTTLARLRREHEHPPSIAQFHGEYRRVNTHQQTRDPFHYECDACEDTGWVDATLVNDTTSSVKPCRCKVGQEAEPVFARLQASRPPVSSSLRGTEK